MEFSPHACVFSGSPASSTGATKTVLGGEPLTCVAQVCIVKEIVGLNVCLNLVKFRLIKNT